MSLGKFPFILTTLLVLLTSSCAGDFFGRLGSCTDETSTDDASFIQKRFEVEYSLEKKAPHMHVGESVGSKSVEQPSASQRYMKKLQHVAKTLQPPGIGTVKFVNPVYALLLLVIGLCGRLVALLPKGSAAYAFRGRNSLPGSAQSQRYSEEAAATKFENWFDVIPKNDNPFISELAENARIPLSYASLHQFAFSSEARLDRFGINPGHRVCTMIPNGPESAVCFLVFPLRCVFAPLNPMLTKQEIEFEFEDLPCHTLVINASNLLEGNIIGVEVAAQQKVQVLHLFPSQEVAGLFKLEHSSDSFNTFPTGAAELLANRQDVALVLHTSGTTKKPKIVPLTHENLVVGALCIQSTLQRDAKQVCLNLMPLYHIHGLSMNVLVSAFSGSSVVCSMGYQGGVDALKCLSQSQATWYSAVPTIHHGIIEAAESAIKNGQELACKVGLARSCSAALAPALALRLEEALDCVALPTYAMTESAPIASNPLPPYHRDLSSVGFAAGPQFVLRGDDAQEVPHGREGEICVKGRCMTKGYEFRDHMDEDPNLQGFHSDGWLRTGDKGYLNHSGFLCLTGRFKEIINRGGEKISPLELEGLFRRHDGILDCLIFAAPHEQLGETVGLVLVPRPGSEFQRSPEALAMARRYALQESSAKWAPECVVFMTQVPKGSTGKPARIGLAKRIGLPVMDATDSEMPRVWDASSGKVVALAEEEKAKADVQDVSPQQNQPVVESQNAMPDSLGLTVLKTPALIQEMRIIYCLYAVGILMVVHVHYADQTALIQRTLLPSIYPNWTAYLLRLTHSIRNATVFTICAGYLETISYGFKFDGKREAVLMLAWLWQFNAGTLIWSCVGGDGGCQPWMFGLSLMAPWDWYLKFLLMSRPILLLLHHRGLPGWLHVGFASALSFCMLRFTVLKGSPLWWHNMVVSLNGGQPDPRTSLASVLYQYSLFAAGAYLVPHLIQKAKNTTVPWNALWVRGLSIFLFLFFPRFNVYPTNIGNADGAFFQCRDCGTIGGALICFSMSGFMDLLWVGNLVIMLQSGCYMLEVVGSWSLGTYLWAEVFATPVMQTGLGLRGHYICPSLPQILQKVVLLLGEGGVLCHFATPVVVFSIMACTWYGVALVCGGLWQFFFGGFLAALQFLHGGVVRPLWARKK